MQAKAVVLFSILVSLASPARPQPAPVRKILKHPRPEKTELTKLDSLPTLKESRLASQAIDLCGMDLRSLDLRGRGRELLFSDFDTRTRWPALLPVGFDPEEVMDKGKNPGLRVRALHRRGITGRGVGVAIIDQNLLPEHVEYRDRLMYYDEIGTTSGEADMHGTATASIAVGETTGVAPGAFLYHLAVGFWTAQEGYDFTRVAEALDAILALNRELPRESRIRVIAMQSGWGKNFKGGAAMAAAVDRVKKEGIFFISSNLPEDYGFFLNGLDRFPSNDPDLAGSYGTGLFWARQYRIQYDEVMQLRKTRPRILIPMDSRACAGPTGEHDYVFYRVGGWSWITPYLAGLYALSCQVRSDVTPEMFWRSALTTGDTTTFTEGQKKYELGVIVNPVRLIEDLAGRRAANHNQN